MMDNWQHRSRTTICSTCMYFVEKGDPDDQKPCLGRCRRHAPALGGWPVVYGTDWCGDHKLDRDKV